jgi:hypothetical protein
MRTLVRLGLAFVLTAAAAARVESQGGATTAPLSGLVLDTTGAAVPGANVVVTNEESGASFQAVTTAQGTFTVPALQPGTYAVTVSLAGFKQIVLKDVKVLSATPASVRATLEVGGMEETVTVEGGAELVQTQSAAISTTVEVNQITNLPVTSRSALEFITFLPGVQSVGDQTRNSLISGLDQSAINITIDGMSTQDNFLKTTDGFFTRVSPRLDAVEEVTLTTAGAGADNSGQGATQIQFTTRRGTNEYHGSVYEYFRRDWLNANSWFNNRDLPPDPKTGKAPQAKLKFDEFGIRLGGPIRIPGLFDGRDKAFFFVNYEEHREPSDITRNRIVLSPSAQRGVFSYSVGGAVRSVDLLELAARNGQLATLDPTVSKLLADIRAATGESGGVANLNDPLVQRYTYQVPRTSLVRYPTLRLDFQLSDKHLLSASTNVTSLLTDPDTLNNRDPQFPGFPIGGVQDSKRYTVQGTLRSTLNANLVNELRVFGATGGATKFSTEINPSMWKGTSIADQAGFHLNLNGACCGSGQTLTNAAGGGGPNLSSREASTKVAYDHVTWVKGSHSLAFGLDFTEVNVWLWNQTQVPTINFGIATGDPAEAMFTTANFPGASAAQLNNARGLYAMLTARATAINGNIRLDENTDEYEYLGASRQRARVREFDLFAHDTWRANPRLTLNYGVRYAIQLPYRPLNNSYATASVEDVWGISGVGNLFRPGVLGGRRPQFVQFEKGRNASKTDWNNVAPSLGFAWRPPVERGFLRALLGSEPVIRGGFAIAYNRNGMSDFTNIYGSNPGVVIDVNRNQSLGNLGSVPVLLRDLVTSFAPPAFAARPSYPLTDVITGDVRIFDPNLKIPYSQTWTFSVQRTLGKTMAMDVRYVGSRGRELWETINYNESNIVENGFLNEFRLAQQNLQANIRAGRGNTFAYTGVPGTAPLPIYLGYLNGVPASQAADPSRYTGASWSSTNFTNPLAIFNPNPFVPAGTNANTGLEGNPTRRANALRAGLPPNFFRANPDLLGGAFMRTNGGFTNYHGFEVELKRRYSRGLQFQSSYTFGKAYSSNFYTLRKPRTKTLNTGTEGGVTHGFKFAGTWDLPIGKGRRLGGSLGGVLDAILGGWQLNATARVQSGTLVDFGNVRLAGMSRNEFQQAFRLRFDDAGRKVYMLPQDIIDNTRRAFSVQATSPTGYGALGPPSGRYLAPANGPDCIELRDTAIYGSNNVGYGDACGLGELVVTGPLYRRVDLGIQKRFELRRGLHFIFRAELLNAFNIANFTPVTGGGTTVANSPTAFQNAANYEVTDTDGPRVAQLVARITW